MDEKLKSDAGPGQANSELSFDLDATEEELLDEFGLLMAAEYGYMVEPDVSVTAVRPNELNIRIRGAEAGRPTGPATAPPKQTKPRR